MADFLILYIPVLFALSHAYMGETLNLWYPKYGRDQIAYMLMAVCTYSLYGVFSIASFFGFWILFVFGWDRILPWVKYRYKITGYQWFPYGTFKEKLDITIHYMLRITWATAITLGAITWYVYNWKIALLFTTLFSMLGAMGFLAGSYVGNGGDKEVKLGSGFGYGLSILITQQIILLLNMNVFNITTKRISELKGIVTTIMQSIM